MPFEELKARQSVVWGAGAYEPIVEITSEIHEALVAALDGGPGQRWLDIATGPARSPCARPEPAPRSPASTWPRR
jgi:hypothetical protein